MMIKEICSKMREQEDELPEEESYDVIIDQNRGKLPTVIKLKIKNGGKFIFQQLNDM